MKDNIIKGRVINKHDTFGNWNTAGENGFIPKQGEIIIYDKAVNRPANIKIGDGVTKVSDLDYLVSPVGLSGSYKDLTNKPNIDFIKCLMDPTHYTNEVSRAYESFIYLTKEEPGGIALIQDKSGNVGLMIIEFGLAGSHDFLDYEYPVVREWRTRGIYDFIPLDPEFDSTNLAIFDDWYTDDEGQWIGHTFNFSDYIDLDVTIEGTYDEEQYISADYRTDWFPTLEFYTAYSDSNYQGVLAWFPVQGLTSYVWTCFIKGQTVTLANGTVKPIEQIIPGDIVKYITDSGEYAETEVVLPPHKGECTEYNIYRFSDGTELSIHGSQGIWHEGKKKYQDIITFKIGDQTKKLDGTIITLEAIEKIECNEPIEHYFLFTYNGNYSVNNILTCTDRAKAMIELSRNHNKEYRDRLGADKMRMLRKQVRERFNRQYPTQYAHWISKDEAVLKEKTRKLNNDIKHVQKNLDDTDYQVIKFTEGILSPEEYEPTKLQRIEWREAINKLEAEVTTLQKKFDCDVARIENKPNRPYYPAHGADTMILMADGTEKPINTIQAGDMVAYINNETIEYTKVILPVIEEYVWDATKYTFENGATILTSDEQNPFCINYDADRSPMEFTVGDSFKLANENFANVAIKDNIQYESQQSFYRLVTASGGYIVNNIPYQVEQSRIENELSWEENEYYALNQ